ncbi:MAG: sulfite exporter TauE/SafE family protein [Zoogloeaceae bacterium]|jgi:sulfite exporter TauE/SafE|nr:sulfite exporter TauE/SafE family protein [Zoogloeaceae bacterium]
MNEPAYGMLFLFGLFGGTHCLGMCGGIVGALGMGSAPRFFLQLAYNLGRLLAYAFAGLVAGGLGAALGAGGMAAAAQAPARLVLMLFANFMLLAAGLYLMGLPRILAFAEKQGQRLWRRIQPLSRRFLPVRHAGQALPLGFLWGWLPCGLVYSALGSALGSASPAFGALAMLAFGLGTLPNLLLAGFILVRFRVVAQSPWLRGGAGILIFAYGAYGICQVGESAMSLQGAI